MELLVVIAVIGVLVALLLPAVQAAREAARRTQCQNNLRLLGTALLNYEQQHKELPVGCIGYGTLGDELQRLISWNVQLLPFIEQEPLWNQYQLNIPSYSSPNRELGATVLPIFLCPSTPSDQLLSSTNLWKGQAFTDYAGLFGVEGDGHDNLDYGTGEMVDPHAQPLNDESLGIMIYNVAVSFKQITDGTALTASVGEATSRRITTMEWANGHNIFAQDQVNGVNGIGGLDNEIGSPHPRGASVTFCDGHVAFLHDEIEQFVLNALLTRSGGEAL